MGIKISGSIIQSGPPIETSFFDGHGQPADGLNAIFPIVQVEENYINPEGTGFFISNNGLFATAAHVLQNRDRSFMENLFGMEIIRGNPHRIILREIIKKVIHETADVAVGILKTENGHTNKCLKLTKAFPKIGQKIGTWSYPKPSRTEISASTDLLSFDFSYLHGTINHVYPEGRDWLVPYHCFEALMESPLQTGSSGGPVAFEKSYVFGINARGYNDVDVAYIASITDIFKLELPGMLLPGEAEGRSVSIQEIAERGLIGIE